MKKLNDYLLTHYPLVWNLRLHWLWPVILLLHLLFWIAGYSAVSFPYVANYYSMGPGGATFSMAVLCGLLLIALWLIFYFRNNAFKSFYPLAKGRLVAEFGLILLTAFGLCTFVASNAGGTYMHVRRDTRTTDLVAETNTMNLAQHFLPFSRERFSVKQDCDYVHNANSTSVASVNDEPVDTATRYGNATTTDTFSYLHYCGNMEGYYYNRYRYNDTRQSLTVLSSQENDSIAKRWLHGGQRDSVAQLLTRFLALCKKYDAGYRYDVSKGVAEIFATPGFLVRGIISDDKYSAEHFNEHSNKQDVPLQPGSYIETRQVAQALSTIAEARDGWLRPDMLMAFLYFSLGIALLIFSFRTTSVRVWFIALIGMAVWMAIFGVMAAVTRGNEVIIMTLFVLLSVGFLISATMGLRQRASRRNVGVMLLWALWSMPVLALFIMALIEKASRPWDEIDYNSMDPHPLAVSHPVYDWITNHWTLINYLNIALTIVVVCLVFIPLLRRWQAAAEE